MIKLNEEKVLLCPCCDGENLHIIKVKTFTPEEGRDEIGVTMFVECENGCLSKIEFGHREGFTIVDYKHVYIDSKKAIELLGLDQ